MGSAGSGDGDGRRGNVPRLVDASGPGTLGRQGMVAFETVRVHSAYVSRYLRLDQKRAYEVGNGCGTCQFWFTRLEGANRNVSVDALRDRLGEGITTASDPAVETFSTVLGAGTYLVLLLDVLPTFTQPDAPDGYFAGEQVELWGIDGFWGLPHYPKVPYYRLPDTEVSHDATLFQFVVPMHPPNWLDRKTVAAYGPRLDSDATPTAVALSVLDVKQPAMWADGTTINTHWCLAHYLLDGHHKLHAAATTGREIRLLSYVAVDEGVSSPDDVDRLRQLL